MGMGVREKAEEHDGTGGACARGSVATAYGRRPGRLLRLLRHCLVLTSVSYQLPSVLSSDRHVARSPPRC
eukprot:6189821-Pleurochrysis_carterae.AAC.2